MKISCEVALDLMPLCVDGALSEQTVMLLKEHMKDCPDCRKLFHGMYREKLKEKAGMSNDQELRRLSSGTYWDLVMRLKNKQRKALAGAALLLLAGGIVGYCVSKHIKQS